MNPIARMVLTFSGGVIAGLSAEIGHQLGIIGPYWMVGCALIVACLIWAATERVK